MPDPIVRFINIVKSCGDLPPGVHPPDVACGYRDDYELRTPDADGAPAGRGFKVCATDWGIIWYCKEPFMFVATNPLQWCQIPDTVVDWRKLTVWKAKLNRFIYFGTLSSSGAAVPNSFPATPPRGTNWLALKPVRLKPPAPQAAEMEDRGEDLEYLIIIPQVYAPDLPSYPFSPGNQPGASSKQYVPYSNTVTTTPPPSGPIQSPPGNTFTRANGVVQ